MSEFDLTFGEDGLPPEIYTAQSANGQQSNQFGIILHTIISLCSRFSFKITKFSFSCNEKADGKELPNRISLFLTGTRLPTESDFKAPIFMLHSILRILNRINFSGSLTQIVEIIQTTVRLLSS
jgi:hypothetical protein